MKAETQCGSEIVEITAKYQAKKENKPPREDVKSGKVYIQLSSISHFSRPPTLWFPVSFTLTSLTGRKAKKKKRKEKKRKRKASKTVLSNVCCRDSSKRNGWIHVAASLLHTLLYIHFPLKNDYHCIILKLALKSTGTKNRQ